MHHFFKKNSCPNLRGTPFKLGRKSIYVVYAYYFLSTDFLYFIVFHIFFCIIAQKLLNMKKKNLPKLNRILVLSVFLLLSINLNAQSASCANKGQVTGTLTTTDNHCGGDGSITVNTSSSENINLFLYRKGNNNPIIEVSNAKPSHVFSTLQPGNYIVEARCNSDLSIVYYRQDVTIRDAYVPISGATVSSSVSCTGFKKEATISVDNIVGGTAPYTYSVLRSDAANYDDTLSNYQSSPNFTVNEYGTYQIRIKDHCGNFYTVTREVNPSKEPVKIEFISDKIACNTTKMSLSRIRNANSNAIISGEFSRLYPEGVQLTIRHGDANGKIVFNGLYTGQDINVETAPIPSNKVPVYHYTVTNSCGVETSYSINQNEAQENIAINTVSEGCFPNEHLRILITPSRGLVVPIKVDVKDESGNIIKTLNYNDRKEQTMVLPIGSYSITAKDACGITYNDKVNNPKLVEPVLKVRNYLNNWCRANFAPLTLTNATQALVHVQEGYIPDAINATAVIISGPSNVGVQGLPSGVGRWAWTNILPGDYMVAITSCGVTQHYPLNIGNHGLKQSVKSVGQSNCSGGGNIVSKVEYNGAYQNIVELLDADGRVIRENASGNFDNLPAGTYTTRLKITINKCDDASQVGHVYYIPGNTITLTENSAGPKVSGVAIVCETSGHVTNTGTAHLNIQGSGPYTIRYKEVGESNWTIINNVNTADYSISGLKPNAVYSIDVIDSCGKSHIAQYTVGTIADHMLEASQHPCQGSPYTLKGQYFAGASYRWINPAGVEVSTEKDYHIPSYNNSMDGTYTLETKWGECVIRYTSISIYGSFCNTPIVDNNISGNVFFDKTKDNIVSGTGIGAADNKQLYISIERTDERGVGTGNIITTVKVNKDGSYKIPSIPEGFYKIILGINPLGSTTSSLPLGWYTTGESIPTSASGETGNLDGVVLITQQKNKDTTDINFGIYRDICYKPANTTGATLPAKFGITTLGRASNNTWPTVRGGAHMVLEAKTKGFVLNRVNNPTTDISSPVEGMMVYDITNDCISIYDGATWKCLTKQSCPD